jgi:predicted RNase H-like HicB family nuclease
MKTIKIIIEKSSDSYGAYAENVAGIYGAGDSAEECKQSILDAIETIKTLDDDQIPEVLKNDYQLAYKFDAQSFLGYYKVVFTNSALEKMTGINRKQIQHYASGHRKPKEETIKKIETALHNLGRELLAVEL